MSAVRAWPRYPWWVDDTEWITHPVDFHLSYKGPLPKSDDRHARVEAKQRIRACINTQLWQLTELDKRFRTEIDRAVLAEMRGSRLIPKEESPGFMVVHVGGYWFLPLVDRRRSLVCYLNIKFLRRGSVGQIVHGGDLDNRIKTLCDALRIPQHANEVPAGIKAPLGPTMLCLLEDDALIVKLLIDTGMLLDPLVEGESATDVRLEMDVSIRPGPGTGADHWLGQP